MKKLIKAAKYGRNFSDWIGKTVKTRDGSVVTIEDCSYSYAGGIQGWYDNENNSILLMDDNDRILVEIVDDGSSIEGAYDEGVDTVKRDVKDKIDWIGVILDQYIREYDNLPEDLVADFNRKINRIHTTIDGMGNTLSR